jgi:hypothetical protein
MARARSRERFSYLGLLNREAGASSRAVRLRVSRPRVFCATTKRRKAQRERRVEVARHVSTHTPALPRRSCLALSGTQFSKPRRDDVLGVAVVATPAVVHWLRLVAVAAVGLAANRANLGVHRCTANGTNVLAYWMVP